MTKYEDKNNNNNIGGIHLLEGSKDDETSVSSTSCSSESTGSDDSDTDTTNDDSGEEGNNNVTNFDGLKLKRINGLPNLSFPAMATTPTNAVTGPGKRRLSRIESEICLTSNGNQPLKKRMKRSESAFCMQSQLTPSRSNGMSPSPSPKQAEKNPRTIVKPDDFLKKLLEDRGASLESMMVPEEDSYLTVTKKQIERYPQVAQLARDSDLDGLRKLHTEGIDLQCANRFGESVLHIVCRRGYYDLLTFLLRDAGTSVRVKDDFGRTPLHDAAWTHEPDFRLIRLILTDAPDLIFAHDKRGFSALAYVPPQRWGAWCEFLGQSIDLIMAAKAPSKN